MKIKDSGAVNVARGLIRNISLKIILKSNILESCRNVDLRIVRDFTKTLQTEMCMRRKAMVDCGQKP